MILSTLVPLMFSTNINVTQNLPKVEPDGNEAIKTWQRRHTLPTCSLVFFRAVTFPAVRNTNTMTTRRLGANRNGQCSLQHPYLQAVFVWNTQQNEATPVGTATSYSHQCPNFNQENYKGVYVVVYHSLTLGFSSFVTPRLLNTIKNLSPLPLQSLPVREYCSSAHCCRSLSGCTVTAGIYSSSFTTCPRGKAGAAWSNDHSSSTDVKNAWRFTSTPPTGLYGAVIN
jgi:hypothetical protein